jgi:primosomal protein N' (replication factor Y)
LSKNERVEYEQLKLTNEQNCALGEIEAASSTEKYAAFLLHGVTGSGKTEVYIRAMRSALARGKTALMLVPEIALTPVFSRRLQATFGDDVAILHSNLSPGERFDEWRRIRSGDARVVIGTRSAVFAPLENLGIIIVTKSMTRHIARMSRRFITPAMLLLCAPIGECGDRTRKRDTSS